MKMKFKSEFGYTHASMSESSGSKLRLSQVGQGMTEYIIIVALIALASITAVNFFGNAVQGAFGGIASVLGGGDTAAAEGAISTASTGAVTEAGKARDLGDYSD